MIYSYKIKTRKLNHDSHYSTSHTDKEVLKHLSMLHGWQMCPHTASHHLEVQCTDGCWAIILTILINSNPVMSRVSNRLTTEYDEIIWNVTKRLIRCEVGSVTHGSTWKPNQVKDNWRYNSQKEKKKKEKKEKKEKQQSNSSSLTPEQSVLTPSEKRIR